MPAEACKSQSGSHRYSTGHDGHVDARPTPGSHSEFQPGHENGYPSVPSQTHGQQGKPYPAYGNVKPSVSAQGSPVPINNNGSYLAVPHFTASTSQPDTTIIPPVMATSNKGHEAASMTSTTKAVVTSEEQAPKSTQGLYPSQPAEAPSTPVITSGANKYQLRFWTWMAGTIGLVAML
ncbi:hypothetical protein ACHAP5_011909 [Fusarium lateritium]